MKTYVLIVSRTFPKGHNKEGEQTFFVDKISNGEKIHTIRSNYPLWKKRIKEVQEGKAVLSLRYWSEKPYRSKQVEFARLDKDSGIGVQEIYFINKNIYCPDLCSDRFLKSNIEEIAKNDGLSIEDFKEWFKNYDLSKPLAIIHFTNFRY